MGPTTTRSGGPVGRGSGWAPHSKALVGYLEVVERWEDNALLGVL
ncbi:hypothetical protein AB0H07_35930 [Streptomyces sp. NPDC021354]